MLSREGVSFSTKYVDEDEAAYDELLKRGFRSVPVTIIDDQAIAGFRPDEIKAALAARQPDR